MSEKFTIKINVLVVIELEIFMDAKMFRNVSGNFKIVFFRVFFFRN